jgi:hypothetical protein
MQKNTTVYIDSKQLKAMEDFKKQTGVPVGRQIQDAIAMYLRQKAGAR